MKKQLFAALSAALLTLASCGEKNQYTIDGTVEGMDGSQVVMLAGRDTLATTTVQNGTFTFEGVVDSVQMVAVVIDRPHAAQIFLEPGKIALNLNDGNATGTALNNDLTSLSLMTDSLRAELERGASENIIDSIYNDRLQQLFERHPADALGLMLLQQMAYDMEADELAAAMEKCDLYKNDARLQKLIDAKKAAEATSAGHNYLNVEGVNAETGEPMTLADIVAQGKPVIVDFWASWCGPCKREINSSLSVYAPKYKDQVNFVGIAVWENSIEDTQKAMAQLPISWPVIFAGGRQDSPTEQYGISGIPHIMLIGADGVIRARDLRGAAIEEAILEELGK